MEVWAEGVASSVRVHARGQVCTVKYVHCQVCMRAGVQLSSMFTVKCVKLIHATVKYVHCQICNCVKCVESKVIMSSVQTPYEIHSCVQECIVKYVHCQVCSLASVYVHCHMFQRDSCKLSF